jgi:hypothetical protein
VSQKALARAFVPQIHLQQLVGAIKLESKRLSDLRRTAVAELIKASGEVTDTQPTKGGKRPKFTLEELQGFVGGYIELVDLGSRDVMVVNEEGRIHGLPINMKASARANRLIVGDVVVCKRGEV